jgi:hypothetical protein
MEMSGQLNAPVALPRGKIPWYYFEWESLPVGNYAEEWVTKLYYYCYYYSYYCYYYSYC